MISRMRPRPAARATARILLVEDDLAIAEAVGELLENEGYRVWHAPDASSAELLLDEARPDLILLDIMLPDTNGLVLCGELRARWSAPIIVVSASQRRSDPILALRLGADDFIAKPFDVRHLLARVETVLRRSATARLPRGEPEVYRFGPLTIDAGRRSALYHDTALRLTPTEFRLLAKLASEPDQVFSRDELTQRVWGYEASADSRMIDVHIRRLRQKLEQARMSDPQVVTLRGFGYKLSRASTSISSSW